MQKKLGHKRAESLQAVLGEIVAAENFEILMKITWLRPHPLIGNYAGTYALDIDKSYRLIVRPYSEKQNVDELAQEEINELLICKIEDYH